MTRTDYAPSGGRSTNGAPFRASAQRLHSHLTEPCFALAVTR
jgi:hypothetical protein